MAGLGAVIGALLFLGIFFIVLKAGNKAIDVGVSGAAYGAQKAGEAITKASKPVLKKANELAQKVGAAVFRPNTFSVAWTLEEFLRLYGPHVKIASHINNKTQKVFHTCEIYNSEGKTYSVRFSASLGELSPTELKDRKSKLFVGRTNSGKFYLYDEYFKDWEDIDLSV